VGFARGGAAHAQFTRHSQVAVVKKRATLYFIVLGLR